LPFSFSEVVFKKSPTTQKERVLHTVSFRSDNRDHGNGYFRDPEPVQSTKSDIAAMWRNQYTLLEPATEQERQWFLDNTRVIINCVKDRWSSRHFDSLDDLLAWAFPIVVRALRYYDPKKAASDDQKGRVTYVTSALRHEAGIHLKRYGPFFRGRNDNRRPTDLKVNPTLFGHRTELVVEDREDTEAPDEVKQRVMDGFRTLKPKHQEVLSAYLGLDGVATAVVDIAIQLKVTRERVYQIINDGLWKIAEHAKLEGVARMRTTPERQRTARSVQE
jgi:hypothetical protein